MRKARDYAIRFCTLMPPTVIALIVLAALLQSIQISFLSVYKLESITYGITVIEFLHMA